MGRSDEPRAGIGELVSAGLLAAATVASAWCAYQAALWSGEQTRCLARSTTAHFQALRWSGDAHTMITIDATTFLSYVHDELHGDRKTAEIVREHVRPEFRPALDEWIAELEAGRVPRELPFKSPLYQLKAVANATRLSEQASAALKAANEASGCADLFVLHTVLLAVAMFFLGSASAARWLAVQRVMSVLGALAFLLSAISIARLPRAPSGPHARDVTKAESRRLLQ